MPIDLKIPHVGESITEVQIAEWLKAEGDPVARDETVAVIDSEKTTFELPSPQAGTISKLLHQAGETVKVGQTVAQIDTGHQPAQSQTAAPAARPNAPEQASAETVSQRPTHPKAAPDPTPAPPAEPERPAANATIEPPAQAAETAPVRERETESIFPASPSLPAKEQVPPTGRGERIAPMSMLRRTAARRLVEAKQQMAMLTTFNEIDMSAVQSLRHQHQESFEKRHGTRLGLMSFFVKAAVDALTRFPQVNACIRDNDVVYRDYFDVGVAIASDRGLVVPALRNAGSLGFAAIEKAVADFARRAREGKLKPDELEGGTFTITNGGVFGSLFSTPIINPPQSGILGLHAIRDRPAAVQGQVLVRPMMYVALTYDHRLVDGREAVLFLQRIKEIIETPSCLLLEI